MDSIDWLNGSGLLLLAPGSSTTGRITTRLPRTSTTRTRCPGSTAIPSLKNACGKMLQGIAGKNLASGDEIDVATFVGHNFLIVVQATESGATRVETASAPPV